MGTFTRITLIVLVAAISGFTGWWLHRPAPLSTLPAVAEQGAFRAPAVDATPQYLAHMAHHFGSPRPYELRQLKKDALAGSKKAVDRLILTYWDCASMEAYLKKAPVCGRQANFWIQIARENESQSGANLAFNDLRDSPRCEDIYRARFWLDKMLAVTPGTPWKEDSEELAKRERRCG